MTLLSVILEPMTTEIWDLAITWVLYQRYNLKMNVFLKSRQTCAENQLLSNAQHNRLSTDIASPNRSGMFVKQLHQMKGFSLALQIAYQTWLEVCSCQSNVWRCKVQSSFTPAKTMMKSWIWAVNIINSLTHRSNQRWKQSSWCPRALQLGLSAGISLLAWVSPLHQLQCPCQNLWSKPFWQVRY